MALIYVIFAFAIFWLLAVFKVFILDDGKKLPAVFLSPISHPLVSSNVVPVMPVKDTVGNVAIPSVVNRPGKQNAMFLSKRDQLAKIPAESTTKRSSPLSSEWSFIRSDRQYRPEIHDIEPTTKAVSLTVGNPVLFDPAKSAAIDGNRYPSKLHGLAQAPLEGPLPPGIMSAAELKWPPVQPAVSPGVKDGWAFTIPDSEGFDTMPLLGIKVPRFWLPPPGTDLNTIGSKVNGHETIFLMIASYRDFQCRETITSAYMRADHPEALYVGAVDQLVPGDVGCLDLDVPCSEDPSQMICKYRDQISVFKMDAQYATGPVTARHIGDRMYRGQYYVMQMDAHCLFINHWDTKIITQFKSTGNEMAVLSSYLTDVQGSITPEGESTRNTRPIMCNSDFEGQMPARYLRHGSQPEMVATVKDMPQLQPFWAAGFSFSRGHFKIRVPYDAYQPMVFQGEEIAIGIRAFTHGYDLYAPRDSVVFHEYAEKSSRRKKIHMFWENSPTHAGEGQKSLRRSTSVIGMAPDIDPATWDHSELDKYGLGSVRDLQLFYKLFLIDTHNRKAVQLCPLVTSGVMHRDFMPYMRADGNGIDYTPLVDYDTKRIIDLHLGMKLAEWERRITYAVDAKDKQRIQDALDNARKYHLEGKNPSLIQKAESTLRSL